MSKTLYWVPRIFGILLIIFVSLFALDVFGADFSWVALLIHLIPTLILVAILLISWKWPKVGGVLWILIGLYYVFMTKAQEHYVTYLVITLPAVINGVLFLMQKQSYERKTIQSPASSPIPQAPQQPVQSGGDAEVRNQTQD